MQSDRRQRFHVELADTAQRIDDDPPLRFELRVETKLGPVATAALSGRGTRIEPTPRRRGEQFLQPSAREALLYLDDLDPGGITRIDARDEDRKTIDAADRLAARAERIGSDIDEVA